MWKRSEVEQLTGLTRHMIQDLCNQNTAGDGLAFWQPAVFKPGYSRFDEGDLLVFYLVKQLSNAGFALAEVEATMFDMLEDDQVFRKRVEEKVRQLSQARNELEDKLRAASSLEHAAGVTPVDRPYAVMMSALRSSVHEALAYAEKQVVMREGESERIALAVDDMLERVFSFMGWSGNHVSPEQDDSGSRLADEDGAAQAESCSRLAATRAYIVDCVRKCVDPSSPDAQSVISCVLNDACAWIAADNGSGFASRVRRLLIHAADRFLGQAENGAPVELMCGKGSFRFLGQSVQGLLQAYDQ